MLPQKNKKKVSEEKRESKLRPELIVHLNAKRLVELERKMDTRWGENIRR